jgi:Co/Zn/Cd efflux system component
MQDSSGITAVSIPVSEILVVGLLGLLAAVVAFWIFRRVRQKKNQLR